MCKALENLKEEGKIEGKIEAVKNTIKILRDLHIEDTIILQKIQKEFQVSEDLVREYL